MKGKDTAFGKKIEDDYREKNYHRPSDEFDASTWTLEGAIKDLGLLFAVGKKLASEETMPQWKPGSEFRSKRQLKN